MSLFPKFRMILPAMHRLRFRHSPEFWPTGDRFFPSLWDSFHSPWHVKPSVGTRFSYVEVAETVGGTEPATEGNKPEGASSEELPHERTEDPHGFKVSFDVSKFKPEEITVRSEDGELVVEGKQEVKKEDGYSTRRFVRTYSLPQNIDRESFKSRLSKDGVLSIEVKKLQPINTKSADNFIKIEKED